MKNPVILSLYIIPALPFLSSQYQDTGIHSFFSLDSSVTRWNDRVIDVIRMTQRCHPSSLMMSSQCPDTGIQSFFSLDSSVKRWNDTVRK
ncbi:hypothetical protein [Wolbachia endosymbiont of Ctenocephalides felis wCfeJ]|uniref:hypothetical protein n=1 Tax=Wolbachia endosymbiont of Ctenocephalides felis wCfeJ TaxID=2732594 RepID=UPI001444EFDB|nr:hypothetical protein [Wolbachia endosymbiont of Ctenocephalides felis wCfeJ]